MLMIRSLLDRWFGRNRDAESLSLSEMLREEVSADAIIGPQKVWPIHPVAILVGLAMGWQWVGMKMILMSVLGPAPTLVAMWAAIVLLMTGLGPWLPEQIILRITSLRRFRPKRNEDDFDGKTGTEWILKAVRERDESLTWLTFAFLTGTAGVVSLIVLALSGVFAHVYEWLIQRFFWTELTLTLLDWGGVAFLVGLSWVLNGLIVAVLPPVIGARRQHHRDPPGVVSGVLVGLGLALWCHEWWANRGLSGEQAYIIGVLPMFVLAGISAKWSQRTAELRRSGSEEETAPEVRPEGEGLIWMSLVVWGIAAVWAGWGWLACVRSADPEAGAAGQGVCWYVLLIGAGVAAASYPARRRSQSASGCGMAAWVAGIGMGLAATLMSRGSLGWPGAGVCLPLMALPLGYALHYSERAWLARVGSETLGFALCISAILGGAAVGVILAHWWAMPTLGAMGLMCVGSLLMLAFGGLIQVYEQDRALRIREQRLALVFASLACAIVVFPGNARQWGATTGSQRNPTAVEAALPSLVGANRICLIGVRPDAVELSSELSTVRADVLPGLLGDERGSNGRVRDLRVNQVGPDAARALSLTRRRYDLIYHQNRANGHTSRFSEYSFEWFERLAQHTTLGGFVYVDVPLRGLNAPAVRVIASTFEQALDARAQWMLFTDVDAPLLRLRATPGRQGVTDSSLVGQWSSVETLLADGPAVKQHMLRRDRISGILASGKGNVPAALVIWLREHQ